ncbi:SusC/RagA family TonB-linked outer membrane protein [Nubsella zeaxanthinifaciens]|uniref:SusC/RagA family TonB-linked outer membrane protein n=1 Tax=Nubsella zeaxanthinifaciens TaxID=392412 RepID=UPI003CFF363E
MKLTTFLLLISFVQLSAATFGQRVTLKSGETTVSKIFNEIRKQTGYSVMLDKTNFKTDRKISADFDNATVQTVMDQVLKGTDFTFVIEDRNIIVEPKDKSFFERIMDAFTAIGITGKVVDSEGKPLSGASVTVKGTNLSTTTGADGSFTLRKVDEKATIIISFIGFENKEIKAREDLGTVVLIGSLSKLDEVQVIAYGTTTRRLGTGSVVSVKADEIAKSAVNNPLIALAGRVSGAMVTQSSGNIGAGINIQIRGLNSISQGTAPLYIVDGVPFLNSYIGPSVLAVVSKQTPFSTINPADIESIEILKDADATAIYGSRGANGVVLITTKSGKQGSPVVEANISSGVGSVSRRIEMMDTKEYLMMRKEAFANDQRAMTTANAPDVLLWDNNRYTDWQKEIIGGTAKYYNANLSASGGNLQTKFRAAGNYNKETTVYPGDFNNKRGGFNLSVNHKSLNEKFRADFISQYSTETNFLPSSDLTSQITLAPNAPSVYDANGQLLWQENGATFNNPYAAIVNKNKTSTENIINSGKLTYRMTENLELLASGGISIINMDQNAFVLKAGQNPTSNPIASAMFANTSTKSWIIEPQLNYKITIGSGRLNVLLGNTLQKRITDQQRINSSGFPNDQLVTATAFATSITSSTSIVDYRYAAFFGRVNYNAKDKYLINFTARRDGSSRFGPGKQWGNFGALGAAWIFSNEEVIKNGISFLSFGKLRGSVGITGNDQIGDYQFRDNYRNTSYTYQSQIGYIPSRIFNSDYAWEKNKKIEVALDLGLFNDNLFLTVNFYDNVSGNQLINYSLPSQTGFTTVLKNFEAKVQNQGWEFELSARKKLSNSFKWTSSFNISFNKNKLKSFPNLESSTYSNTLVIGKPVNILKQFNLTGVDPASGIYTFSGIVYPTDLTYLNDINPKFFGGLTNNISYKNFDFSFLFQFVKKNGYNYDGSIYSAPGTAGNLPTYYLNRWTTPGQISDIQKFTTSGSAYAAYQNYNFYSNGIITDASFIRLKNIALSYSMKISNSLLKAYLQGQNVFTITRFKGLDPETSYIQGAVLPTLKVWTLGCQINF